MIYRAVDFSGEWCVLAFEGSEWHFHLRGLDEKWARAEAGRLNSRTRKERHDGIAKNCLPTVEIVSYEPEYTLFTEIEGR